MNHLEKFLIYLEQTIQASDGIQEKNKRQGLLSKDMEKANLNMLGYYSGELKKATFKPYLNEIRLKSSEYKKIEEKMIPEPVLKMIKSNKYLNDELQKAKSASD
jgi:hypothetical protein